MIEQHINPSVIFHIIKLSETWKKNGEMLTGTYGITVQQWFILLLLANDPNIIYLQENPQYKPLMAKELAEALNTTRANITNLLNVLIQKGLVAQTEDADDKRCKRLKLTPAGVRLVKKLEKSREKLNNQMLDRFTQKEKENVIGFIQSCLTFMKQDLPKKI